MRESQLQANCIAWSKSQGLLAVNIHGDGYSNKGFPDLLVFGNGKVVAVELKCDSGYLPQPDQIVWRNRLVKVGIPHAFLKSLETYKEFIRKELLQ